MGVYLETADEGVVKYISDDGKTLFSEIEINRIKAYLLACGLVADKMAIKKVIEHCENTGIAMESSTRIIAIGSKTESVRPLNTCSYCGCMYEAGKYECNRCGAPKK